MRSTEDFLLVGFGLEQLSEVSGTDVVDDALSGLIE